MAALQPIGGKLGDRFGRRPLILGSLLYFAVASIGAALSTSLAMLLTFRVQQAVALALTLPNGAALLRLLVVEGRRGRAFGLVGAATSMAAAASPALGGALTSLAGWRAIFAVNVVLLAPALLLGMRAFPRSEGTDTPRPGPFDGVGAGLLLVTLGGLVTLLTQAGALSTAALAGGAVALAVVAALLWLRESRHADPVVRLQLFAKRAFTGASASIALGNLAMYTTLLTVPVLLRSQAGLSSATTGLVLTPLAAMSVLLAPLGGRLADRVGRRLPAVAGLLVAAVGALQLALGAAAAGGQGSLTQLLVALGMMGAGLGFASPATYTAAVESADPADAGVTAGLFSTSRYLGSIVGSSLLALLLGADLSQGVGFGSVFWVVAAAAAAVAALVLPGRRRTPPGGPQSV